MRSLRRAGTALASAAVACVLSVGAVTWPTSAAAGATTGAMIGITTGVPAGAPIRGEDVAPLATVTLQRLTPAAATPGSTLVVEGVIRNVSAERLASVQVLLRYSSDRLEARSEVAQVFTDHEFRSGTRDDDFFKELAPVLRPREVTRYRLEVPVDEMLLGDSGVYVVGVDVRATLLDGSRVTVARTRTLLPWTVERRLPTARVALLWPLAARPALLPGGPLADDVLAGELAPQGALSSLVDVAASAPVTWVVDPDLLVTARAMAQGYEVRDAQGRVSPGAGAQAATGWLRTLRAATAGADLVALPYATPDLRGLARRHPVWARGIAQQALAGAAAAGEVLDRTAQTGVAWPDEAAAGLPMLRRLAGGGIRTVLVRAPRPVTEETASGELPDGQVVTAAGPIRLVGSDSGLDAVLAVAGDPEPSLLGVARSLDVRQRLLAETLLAALEAPPGGDPPTLLAAPPLRWRPDARAARALLRSWQSAAWITPVGAAPLLGADPSPADGGLEPGASPRPEERLSAAHVEQVRVMGQVAERLAAVLTDPEATREAYGLSLLRALSSGWRGDPDEATEYVGAVESSARDQLDQVQVVVPETVTLSSRTGRFPLIVANGMDQDVNVRVKVTPINLSRLSIKTLEPVQVAAGEKATVTVEAEAAANGRLPVSVTLVTEDDRLLGPPQRLLVVATHYGTIGWVVVGVAAALLFGAVVVRLARRGWAARRRSPAELPHEEERVAEEVW